MKVDSAVFLNVHDVTAIQMLSTFLKAVGIFLWLLAKLIMTADSTSAMVINVMLHQQYVPGNLNN